MASISETIAQWRNKQISGTSLMRVLVSYPEWQILVSEEAAGKALVSNSAPSLQLSTGKDGATCLLLFSNSDAIDAYRKANSASGPVHFLKVDGAWVFQLDMDKIDQLWVDPLTPHDIFYGKAQFGALRDMANAIAVEEALIGLRKGNAPDGALKRARDYKNYYLAVTVRNEKPAFIMAPDNNGRSLAVAFTADDTFDAFLPEAQQMADGGEVQQMQTDGEALFDSFLRMKIDGFVFNCAGPIPPVAFAQAAAKYILEG